MNFFKKFTGKKSTGDESENKAVGDAVNDVSEESLDESALKGSEPNTEPSENSVAEPQESADANQPKIPDEAQRIIREAQNIAKDPNAQIRFVIEHKILPSKIVSDPIYVITSLIADGGSYINNFYKGLYTQNKLEEQYTSEDFSVSVPFELGGASVIRLDMPEKNLFPSLCKRIYIAYNEHFTKHLYITVEALANNEYKMAAWIDGEHEEYGKIEGNEEEMLKGIIEDEELAEGAYSGFIDKLMADTKSNPTGLLTNPEEITKHMNAFNNALVQVQKFKQQDKRDEALKLLKEVIKQEAVKYNDTPDIEYHCFRNAFEVMLYANLYHPYNPVKKEKKQLVGMQVDLSAAYLVLGAMMLEKAQFDKAIDLFWKSTEANPVNVQVLFALADAYKGKGYYKSFYEIIKRAHICAVNKADIARIYRNFAFYYIQIKEYDTAAALCYASRYFDKNPQGFNYMMKQLTNASGKEYGEPALEDIKRTLLENGISWGAKELAVSVIKMLNSQFTAANNAQGIEMCRNMLAEATPEA